MVWLPLENDSPFGDSDGWDSRPAGDPGAFDRPDPKPASVITERTTGQRTGLKRYADPFSLRAYWVAPMKVHSMRQRVIAANNRAFRHGGGRSIQVRTLPSGKKMVDLDNSLFVGRKWDRLRKDLIWLADRLENQKKD